VNGSNLDLPGRPAVRRADTIGLELASGKVFQSTAAELQQLLSALLER
jgi:hypothetical protein